MQPIVPCCASTARTEIGITCQPIASWPGSAYAGVVAGFVVPLFVFSLERHESWA